ncbi:MAG: hypothetical protein FWG50_12595 [Kiritimatiellaeota bacterium]|nr:hypothetical protein [Kiritimatiellota bacterium]
MTFEEVCRSARQLVAKSGTIQKRSDYLKKLAGAPGCMTGRESEQTRSLIATLAHLAIVGDDSDTRSQLAEWKEDLRLSSSFYIEQFVRSANPKIDAEQELVIPTYDPPRRSNEFPNPFGLAKKFKGKPYFEIRVTFPNLCWFRFVACKELMHIYTDTFTNTEFDGETLSKLMRLITTGNIPDQPDDMLDAEQTAFYLAIETMLPWELRSQLDRLERLGIPKYYIAKAFMLPQYVLDHVFMEHKKYLTLSKSINENIRL